jgi:hypothetical protein
MLVGTHALFLLGMGTPRIASAQADILLQLRSGSPLGDRFRVDSAGGLVAIGQLGVGIIPATGDGYRMMWHPFKAAFRAGHAGGAGQWDDAKIGFYSWAGGTRSIASGTQSLAFGDRAEASGQTAVALGSQTRAAGSMSFAHGLGSQAMSQASIAIGLHAYAGLSARNAPNFTGGATAIGYEVTADADYSTAMGVRASTNGKIGSFVWGGTSTTSLVDSVMAQANGEFVARAPGGFRFRTNPSLSTGCDLPTGSGVFSCSSSRTLKDDFQTVDGEDVLSHLRAMPVMSWKFIEEHPGVKHIGPFAEDFYAAFGLGDSNTAIGLNDLAGVGIAASKALEQRTAELREENAALRRDVAELRARQAELDKRLAEMQRLIESATRR